MHIVDFFVTKFWQTLPAEWQEYFEQIEMSSLLSMASTGQVDAGAPESLRSYVKDMFRLRLNYQGSRMAAADGDSQQGELWYFLDGMNPKKQVEVKLLSQLVSTVAKESQCSLVVDVGAGQGYLSRVLAYSSYNLPVLAIDSSPKQQRGAETMQQRTIKRLRGSRATQDGFGWKAERAQQLQHTVMHVGLDSTNQLAAKAHNAMPVANTRWMLCGLHACGDLSSAILKAFVESDAAAVAVVPCCYNHISEAPRESAAVGFPLSSGMHGIQLGQNALKTACQATSRWDSCAEATLAAFRRNYFRALLHHLMVAHNQVAPNAMAPAVGKVTNTELQAISVSVDASSDEIAFTTYALAALTKLNHAWRPTAEQCVECYREHGSTGLQQIAAAWTLKSLAGPLVECMLVVDRAMYLAEHCSASGRVSAFALFDPVTSPRNVVLVAQRGNA
ncbi:hypothetical protein IWW36_005054 [Coemansia brasiliensis]|uniref:Methyltransferase domain-containing protein n=1 Tax=Coemansia brasiliensis TaxID=2650707 RepID=A0A9W8I2C8_9FUNG|nr:hypothetical protein IWW36_005054 [Coemansia brasiliensis]